MKKKLKKLLLKFENVAIMLLSYAYDVFCHAQKFGGLLLFRKTFKCILVRALMAPARGL